MTPAIYRYTFTQEFMEHLNQFSKVHQYDHRKDFKEAWVLWTADNEELVATESQRLTELDYKGDIIDKMFKSARYYFRKKTDDRPLPKERKEYISFDKSILDSMDIHILENMNFDWYSPADGFINYCKTNTELLKKEISRLQMDDAKEISQKFKKTYKNRYFMAKKK